MGLGVLCKGPVVLALVAVTVVPYLACARRLREGLALLADARGAGLFLLLALSWPVPVLIDDPNALGVWLLEIGQKVGAAGVPHPHNWRAPLVADWPWMTLPWFVVATLALALPFRKKELGGLRPGVWFPWWWGVGNLVAFGLWSVAKPSYFLPCLPGVALLCGFEWVRMTREARGARRASLLARGVLQAHWVAVFVAAADDHRGHRRLVPGLTGWAVASSLAAAAAVVVSAWAWRRGADALALAPLVSAAAVLVVVGYGVVAPAQNAYHSHRNLAGVLDRLLPPDARTVMFFRELDEGLWFYQRGRDFQAVPGSRPDYNDTYQAVEQIRARRFESDPVKRLDAQKQVLLGWLRRADRPSSYVLLRDTYYDLFAPSLAGLAETVYREQNVDRNALVLLRVSGRTSVASSPTDEQRPPTNYREPAEISPRGTSHDSAPRRAGFVRGN
jgi:hypothetical protein